MRALGFLRILVVVAVTAATACGGSPKNRALPPAGKVPIQFQSTDPALDGAALFVFGASTPTGPFTPLHREPIRWRSASGPRVIFVHEGQPLGADRWYYVAAKDQTGAMRKLVPVTKARVLLPMEGAPAPAPPGKVSR